MADTPPTLIAGPCSLESYDVSYDVASRMKGLCEKYGVHYLFKGSFDKANRTAPDAPRGPGLEAGLEILQQVREAHWVPLVTDVHETWQVPEVANVVDVIQIPAMLSRQTDLIEEAAMSGVHWVMIKKGQAMDVDALINALRKVTSTGGDVSAIACLRGSAFGNGDLVMDFRDVVDLRAQDVTTFVDVTHGVMTKTRDLARTHDYSIALARAAMAAGANGVFAEVHPDPASAPSDQNWMLPLSRAEELVRAVAGQG